MQCTYKRRRPPTSTSSAEPIPSEVISGDGRESSFVPSPPQPTKSTTARTTTENHAATGRSLTPTRAPCKLHARLDPEHRRRRQARLLRTSLGTGSPPPDPRTGTVAMRLAVVIRLVGDVRRAGDGPGPAASRLSLRLSARRA